MSAHLRHYGRYPVSAPMPSEIATDYPEGRCGPVTTRKATPEELARVTALQKPKTAPYIAHDRRGRLMVGWDL